MNAEYIEVARKSQLLNRLRERREIRVVLRGSFLLIRIFATRAYPHLRRDLAALHEQRLDPSRKVGTRLDIAEIREEPPVSFTTVNAGCGDRAERQDHSHAVRRRGVGERDVAEPLGCEERLRDRLLDPRLRLRIGDPRGDEERVLLTAREEEGFGAVSHLQRE